MKESEALREGEGGGRREREGERKLPVLDIIFFPRFF